LRARPATAADAALLKGILDTPVRTRRGKMVSASTPAAFLRALPAVYNSAYLRVGPVAK
jgi:hypothetical protein